MIRIFWMEYQSAVRQLAFICQFCEYLADDLARATEKEATKEEIEDLLEHYCLLESQARELDRQIMGLRWYTSHWLKLERLPLLGEVWRIQLTRNPWLTERKEANRIYFAAQAEMLPTITAFGKFLFKYQRIVFPVTHRHVMSDYEKLLHAFRAGNHCCWEASLKA